MSIISAIMYGQKVRKAMYKYEIWFDGQCIIDRTSYDDLEFETEEEAIEEAKTEIESRIEQWKEDGGYNGETVDDFYIEVKEV